MHKYKKLLFISVSSLLLILIIVWLFLAPKFEKKYVYKTEYKEIVEKYADEYGIDKYLIYAVIKTESDFNEKAVSNVGARGLMQIMPDAFDWVKYKLKDNRDITYDDMYTPEYNIEYCSYLLKFLLDRYSDESLAIAAYHAGMTQVDNWILEGKIENNGTRVENFPSKSTNHYVNKVLKSYESYKNLYEN